MPESRGWQTENEFPLSAAGSTPALVYHPDLRIGHLQRNRCHVSKNRQPILVNSVREDVREPGTLAALFSTRVARVAAVAWLRRPVLVRSFGDTPCTQLASSLPVAISEPASRSPRHFKNFVSVDCGRHLDRQVFFASSRAKDTGRTKARPASAHHENS